MGQGGFREAVSSERGDDDLGLTHGAQHRRKCSLSVTRGLCRIFRTHSWDSRVGTDRQLGREHCGQISMMEGRKRRDFSSTRRESNRGMRSDSEFLAQESGGGRSGRMVSGWAPTAEGPTKYP